MKDRFIWILALAFFGGMMIRWDQRMRQNRRTLLLILGRRGLSSAEDLEEVAAGKLHIPTLRATFKWLTEKTGEVEAVFPPGATEPLYRLTSKGVKVLEAFEHTSKRHSAPGRLP